MNGKALKTAEEEAEEVMAECDGQASSQRGHAGDLSAKPKNEKLRLPPLFMSQGMKDPIVKHQWAKSTFCKLWVRNRAM